MWLALSTAMPTGKFNWPLPVRAGTMAVTSARRPASAGTGARGADVSAGLEWIAHALSGRPVHRALLRSVLLGQWFSLMGTVLPFEITTYAM